MQGLFYALTGVSAGRSSIRLPGYSGRRQKPFAWFRLLYLTFYFKTYAGSHLLSHAVSSTVSSAACVLTIVFGMGTGVSRKRIATRNLFRCPLTSKQQYNPYLLSLERR